MTRIKLCGMSRMEDINAVNRILPHDIGFVFYERSRRYVSPEQAAKLRERLNPSVRAIGVFVDELPDRVAEYLRRGMIDAAQLHGSEDNSYIEALRRRCSAPVIKAFRIKKPDDLAAAKESIADELLLDAGAGDGEPLEWTWLKDFSGSYYLAGGLHPGNVAQAIACLHPRGVDVSSGIETDGIKDEEKMRAFADAVRGCGS